MKGLMCADYSRLSIKAEDSLESPLQQRPPFRSCGTVPLPEDVCTLLGA